jgi:DNA replication licensing factor MCM4
MEPEPNEHPDAQAAPSEEQEQHDDEDDQAAQDNIWGTTVNVAQAQKRFERFLAEYEHHGTKVYPALLQELRETDTFSLNLNCANLSEFDPALYGQLVRYPTEVMELFDCAVTDAYTQTFGEEPEKPIQVRPFGMSDVVSMRELDPCDIDRLMCIRGMITRSTAVIPDMKMGSSIHRPACVQPLSHGCCVQPTTNATCAAMGSRLKCGTDG